MGTNGIHEWAYVGIFFMGFLSTKIKQSYPSIIRSNGTQGIVSRRINIRGQGVIEIIAGGSALHPQILNSQNFSVYTCSMNKMWSCG